MAWLQLIRYKNIIILLATIWMMYFFIALPVLELADGSPRLNRIDYFLFSAVAAILVACGNIMNDLKDKEIDWINRPAAEQIIPNKISGHSASIAVKILLLIGSALVIYLVAKYQLYIELILFPLAVLLLWLYNTFLSKFPFWGNALIALLCGCISYVAIYAAMPCFMDCSVINSLAYKLILPISLISVIATFIREVLKDLEDRVGDLKSGRNTIPIAYGTRISHYTIALTSVLLLIVTCNYMNKFKVFLGTSSIAILSFFVIFPICILIYNTLAKNEFDYRRWSQVLKLVLIAGIAHVYFYIL